MEFTVIYKTYGNDLKWIKYSLISLEKYVSDISETIIYYHDECEVQLVNILDELNLIKLNIRIIPIKYDINGYLKQMVVKCMCFKDVESEYVMYIDSDVIFNNYYTPKSIIKDNKIEWIIKKKNKDNSSENFWKVWENSVKEMTNEEMNIFFMQNGFPFILKRKTIEDAYYKFIEIHNVDYNTFCKNLLELNNVSINDPITGKNGKFLVMANIFEEFEYLGWYSYKFTDDYIFTEKLNQNKFKKQYWSHGGLTEEIESEIKKIL